MIYLISAESYHQIDEELNKIIKKNSYTTFNMQKNKITEVVEEASYFSLDANKKYIIAKNADFFGNEKLSDDEQDLLLKYLNNPNPNTILIFTTLNGLDSRKKICKEIKTKGQLVNVTKLDKRGQNSYLTAYLNKFDYDIDYNTLNYIMDNCYNNLDIMINELDKIMLYYSFPSRIKLEDVKKIVGEEIDSNNFHFVNAVVSKEFQKALKILKDLRKLKVEPSSLVILLAREYRLMYYIKNLYSKMNMNSLISYLSLAEWQITKLYNNSLKYSNNELLKNLVDLSEIDIKIKKGIWDKDIALYPFILDACQ